MKSPLTIALLAFAFVMPGALFAQDNARFPIISPDKFSAKQQEFAKLLTSSPRNGNVNNPPFKDHKVSDPTYNSALAKYGEKGITDIIGLAAYYGITAMALTT